MRGKYIYTIVLGVLLLNNLQGQDRHFSQYIEMSSALNPALAGVMYDTRIISAYRTQWGKVAVSYKNFGIAFEQAIKHKKLKGTYFAISGSIYRDMAGDAKLGNLNPNLGLTGVTKINKQLKLSTGVQGGFMYKTIDVSGLRWDKQFDGYEYDNSRPSGESDVPRSSITGYDLGAGVNLNYSQSEKFISSKDGNKFNIGMAGYHFVPTKS